MRAKGNCTCLLLWPHLYYRLPHSLTMPSSLDTPLAHTFVSQTQGMLHEHAICAFAQSHTYKRSLCLTECSSIAWKVSILYLNMYFMREDRESKEHEHEHKADTWYMSNFVYCSICPQGLRCPMSIEFWWTMCWSSVHFQAKYMYFLQLSQQGTDSLRGDTFLLS